MNSHLSPFTRWALDDARTLDERYLIFVICNSCRDLEWKQRTPAQQQGRKSGTMEWHQWKQYFLNPLLIPPFGEADTELAAAMAPRLKTFSPMSGHEVRSLGDAGSVLAFFPALEEISLGHCKIRDISFLRSLPNLRKLCLSSGEISDYSPLASCVELRHLTLRLGAAGWNNFSPPHYWWDASPLAALTRLEHLEFSPNPAVLRGLSFPVLKTAIFSGAHCIQPDCNHLPDMPQLTRLEMDHVQSLDGVGRFPSVNWIKVGGPLRDFGDIHTLPRLTCLEVHSIEGWPRDVSPLNQCPALVWVMFEGEVPRNYWPLAQAPRLCEVCVPRTPSVSLEVQAVNAALHPWDDIFKAPAPRPVPPLRFIAVDRDGDRSVLPVSPVEPCAARVENGKLFERELLWMHHRVVAAAAKIAGPDVVPAHPQSGTSTYSYDRRISLHIERLEAVPCFPELLDAMRSALADSPHDWVIELYFNLRLTPLDMTDQQREWLRQIEEARHRWDDDDDRVKRYTLTRDHIRETEFRLRVSQEEGETPDPEDFVPPEELTEDDQGRRVLVPSGAAADDEDDPDFELKPFDEQEQNEDGDDDDGHTVATAPPPEPPEDFWEDPYAHPLADSYRFWATLTLGTFYHHLGGNLANVELLMRRPPDLYYPALPKPD